MATLNFANTGTSDHPVFGPVSYRVEDIGYDSDGQVARTLGVMGERVREDSRDPGFCSWAQHVIGATPGVLPDMAVVSKAYYHTKQSLTFSRDEPLGAGVGGMSPDDVVEVIVRPREMAKFIQQGKGVGDCDDFTMYLAALLGCYGIPSEFCTVAADVRSPGNYSHVYLVAYPKSDETGERVRVALDASHGEYPGWEHEPVYKRKQWPVSTTGGCVGLVGWMVIGLLGYFLLSGNNFRRVTA